MLSMEMRAVASPSDGLLPYTQSEERGIRKQYEKSQRQIEATCVRYRIAGKKE